jgi:two-component system, response regulator PdtaR
MISTEKLTILIAEDDPPSRALLAAGLTQGGYRVIEAVDGEEAVRLAIECQPDLAILDVMMPKMGGIDAARAIAQEAGTPFLFLSAVDQTDVVKRAVELGAMGYLVKPFNVTQLVPTVSAALQRASELERLRVAESNLTAALSLGRETSVAVGILMERQGVSQARAFTTLRMAARRQRCKVAQVAARLIDATETLNAIIAADPDEGSERPSGDKLPS